MSRDRKGYGRITPSRLPFSPPLSNCHNSFRSIPPNCEGLAIRASKLSRILGVTLLGSLVGGGGGRDVAIVIGAIGGGVVGNKVQNNYVDKQAGSHIIVRLDNGVHVAVTQPLNPDLYVGERVMIQGSGQSARVVKA